MGARFGRDGKCFSNFRGDESSFLSEGSEEEIDGSSRDGQHLWCSQQPCIQCDVEDVSECSESYGYDYHAEHECFRLPDPSMNEATQSTVASTNSVNAPVAALFTPVKPYKASESKVPSVGTGSTVDTEGLFDSGISLDAGTPVPASRYEAVPEDELDGHLAQACKKLPSAQASQLVILRLGPGDYDIGGRRVFLSMKGPNVVAREAANNEVQQLDWYLMAAAEVEHHLGAGAPAVGQLPRHMRLSFAPPPAPDPQAKKKRKQAMRLAKQQAELREKDAQSRMVGK